MWRSLLMGVKTMGWYYITLLVYSVVNMDATMKPLKCSHINCGFINVKINIKQLEKRFPSSSPAPPPAPSHQK